MTFIKDFVSNLLAANEDKEKYCYEIDSEGLNFFLPPDLFEKAEKLDVNDLLLQQHMHLKILEEEGYARTIKNGFVINSENAVLLDDNARTLLQLPPRWEGHIDVDIRGNAITGYKDCLLNYRLPTGEKFEDARLDGPFLKLTDEKRYLMNGVLFDTLNRYDLFRKKKSSDSTNNESDFYHLFNCFEKVRNSGLSVSLGHLDDGFTIVPEAEGGAGVSVSLTVDEDGSGVLTPVITNGYASPEDIEKRLGQLSYDKPHEEQVLRVGKEIILVNEERLTAIKEIITNKKLLSAEVKEFQKNPTAFIDGSKIELDNGFSLRFKGATIFKQAYFGEKDDSNIDWFGTQCAVKNIFAVIKENKNKPEVLIDILARIKDAERNGATRFEIGGEVISIEGAEEIGKAKRKIQNILDTPDSVDEPPPDSGLETGNKGEEEPAEEKTQVIADIGAGNDEEQDFSEEIDTLINDILYRGEIDYSNIKRTPYNHQKEGIRWILGLIDKNNGGGLLADDMGLGKTFTALCAIEQAKKKQLFENSHKPTLIVAPLSLLDNWSDEVGKNFINSPFKDIVILNGDGLKRYKIHSKSGREIDNQKPEALKDMKHINYALKIGDGFSDNERLDIPERLVITTYQTLRDYQFSLCRIEWNFVIFDEAQNIKNPNAMQTRAAKAVNSDFTLMVTGTPVENSLADFWCIVDTAIPSDKLLGPYQTFRDTYISPILREKENKAEVQEEVGRALRKHIGYFMLRRDKEDNLEGLPSKTLFSGIEDDYTEYIPFLSETMEGFQRKAYEAVRHDVSTAENKRGIVLPALQKLRNISLHPSLHAPTNLSVSKRHKEVLATMNLSGKMKSLLTALEQIKQRDEKVIIFAVNKQVQAFLKGSLGRLYNRPEISVINGDTKAISRKGSSSKSRIELISDFEARNGFNIIIMSPVAAGVGLTVVGANNVIHFERHWNPAKEAQATDRVYRIGQTKDVNIYYPILHHDKYESFDVSLHSLLISKTTLRDAVVTQEQVVPGGCVGSGGETFSNNPVLPEELSTMSWQQFEALCALWARKQYRNSNVSLTPPNDHGADVVIIGDVDALIQCKHTANKKLISCDGIRELNSGPKYYKDKYKRDFNKLILATSAERVSPAVKKDAKIYDVEIVTAPILKKWLDKDSVTYDELENMLTLSKAG